ncbi:MAG: cellulose biosynthesis cyclic di-GMP-binding regulatory protein BcsB [Alphaproteobacteria bacterium]|nr:MAG: cellulose biosynthesis cyclic di-GMP-binding regulatory protein BcsB [Alphaproteobacteria bacterium]
MKPVAYRRSQFRYGLSVACLWAALAGPIGASAQEDVVPEEAPIITAESIVIEGENLFRLPLKQMRAGTGNIELRRSHSFDSVFYSIAPQMHIESANLRLEFVNSLSLVESRSQLRVLNNGNVVGQFRLDPSHPNGVANVEIPVRLIKPGYNNLTFEVAQHYTDSCEDFTAPELWTQIDTEHSELVLNGSFDLANPTLSQLDDLISPNLGGARDFALISASGDMSGDVLRLGGMISQAVALRLEYFMPTVSFERALAASDGEGIFGGLDVSHLEDENVILFGTADEIRNYVAPEVADAITSSFVGIYPLAGHDGKFALIVSGTTAEEVERAALAFSLDNFPFVDASTMLIDDITVPEAAMAAAGPRVEPQSTYKFSELDFQTQTLSAVGEQSAALRFQLPADFYVRESENLELALDMSYGAGFRGDSALNLYLNGYFLQAIPMSSENGATFRDYKVYMPARAFIPGQNTIEFRPAFHSPFGGECVAPGRDNLLLTLAGSSELAIPEAERYVRQPDLSIFERTGFPYTRDPAGNDLAVLVGGDDDDTLSAAFTMVAKLAQVSRAPLYGVHLSFTADDTLKARNVFAVGAIDQIDESVLNGAPVSLNDINALPYPASSRAMAQVAQADYWNDFNAAYEAARGKGGDAASTNIQVKQTGSLGKNSLMIAYESPYLEKKTMTVITAATSSALAANMDAVVQPEFWGQLAGDLALWRADTEKVWVQRAGPLFHVGKIDFFEMMRYHLARAPWWWIFGFLVVIPVFAYVVRALLRDRRRLKETV